MLVSGIYSLSVEVISTKNTISTSGVDIELKQYNQNGDEYTDDGKVFMPGDKINLVTKVNNIGRDCYIRLKLIYKFNNDIIAENNYINGNYKTWEEKDGYYYYKSVFKQKETVELFNELKIPENLSNSSLGKKVSLTIKVDAIQSKHFDNNWDNIEIKKSVDRTYDIDYDGDMTIIYENDSQNHIILDDTFFDNVGNILPGDKIDEVINIENTSKDKNDYYLSIDYNNLTQEEIKVLSKIEAIVTKENGEVVFKDTLASIKNKVLGTYNSGEKDKLIISLYFPLDSDNDYSKLLLDIIVKFSLEKASDKPVNPVTGDNGIVIYMVTFILSSIGFIIVLFVEKKNTLNIKN